MFEKSKELYVVYDNIYRKAREVSEYFFKWTLFFIFLAFGFMGNVEFNPNASLKVAMIECVFTMVLAGICVYFGNKYQNISEEYKEKAEKEYIELLNL